MKKLILINAFATFFLFFVSDILLTKFFFKVNKFIEDEKTYRIKNDDFHHSFLPSFSGTGDWGNNSYRVCTDRNGFKSSCDKKDKADKYFDIAFIGDSFTEGIGLEYQDSFVGMFANEYPNLKIANLGVSSYSPSIYFNKIRYLINNGYFFDHIYIFIDISDIQDESLYYRTKKGNIKHVSDDKIKNLEKNNYVDRLKETIKRNFYLTTLGIFYIKDKIKHQNKINKEKSLISKNKSELILNAEKYFNDGEILQSLKIYKNLANIYPDDLSILQMLLRLRILTKDFNQNYIDIFNHERSAWTYNKNVDKYGSSGVQGSINKAILEMENLYKLLLDNEIKMSIGIYPWPAQLVELDINSEKINEQSKIWNNFCQNKCFHFIDMFEIYKNLLQKNNVTDLYNNFYISGDVHFNKNGNLLIYNELKKYNFN